jgi:hypothetical protein
MSDMDIRATRDPTAASIARGHSQQVASARSKSASVEAPQMRAHEYYSSPHGEINPETGVLVMQIRDSKTGAVINQYPSEKAAAEYNRSPVVIEKPVAKAPEPAPVPAPKAQPVQAPVAIASAPTPTFSSNESG